MLSVTPKTSTFQSRLSAQSTPSECFSVKWSWGVRGPNVEKYMQHLYDLLDTSKICQFAYRNYSCIGAIMTVPSWPRANLPIERSCSENTPYSHILENLNSKSNIHGTKCFCKVGAIGGLEKCWGCRITRRIFSVLFVLSVLHCKVAMKVLNLLQSGVSCFIRIPSIEGRASGSAVPFWCVGGQGHGGQAHLMKQTHPSVIVKVRRHGCEHVGQHPSIVDIELVNGLHQER